MTEFEWRRQMRGLRSDLEPPAHVWTAIRSRLGADDAARPPARGRDPITQRHRFGWPALAAAAVIVVSFTVALLAPLPHSASPGVARVAPPRSQHDRDASSVPPDNVLVAELARNPVLAATDAELRELQEQLHRALAQQPDSSRLRRMLMRADDERRRLLQYQSQLG